MQKQVNVILVTSAAAICCLAMPGATARAAVGSFSVTAGNLTTARAGAVQVRLPNGKILLAGGSDGVTYLASAELFDPATGKFSATGSMPDKRAGAKGVLLRNGKVLITGGAGAFDLNQFRTAALLYDYRTGTFTTTGSLHQVRTGGTATLLNDGRVLVAGGSQVGSFYFNNAETYDPATGAFTTLTPMYSARDYGDAVLLRDGRVLIVGGYSGGGGPGTLAAAEIFNPKTNTFSPTEPMPAPRQRLKAATLTNGKALIVGGWNGNDLASSLIYDPKARTFSPTGAMASARSFPAVTELADGRVLVNAGTGSGAGAELYDPTTGYFTDTGPMKLVNQSSDSVLLANGNVLFAGGWNVAPLATAQVFSGPLPTAKFLAKPSAKTKSSKAVFKLVSNGYSPSFLCALDKRGWKTCPATAGFSGLKRGRHTLKVRSLSLGVASSAIAWSWRVR